MQIAGDWMKDVATEGKMSDEEIVYPDSGQEVGCERIHRAREKEDLQLDSDKNDRVRGGLLARLDQIIWQKQIDSLTPVCVMIA